MAWQHGHRRGFKVSLFSKVFKGAAKPGDSPAAPRGAAELSGRDADGAARRDRWLAETGMAGVALKAVAPPGSAAPGLADSKLGGEPYLPSGTRWPRSAADPEVRLSLLAQLNLGQLPAVPAFPRSGVLQFFIAAGETHGMHLTNLASGAGHAVLYHPEAPEAPAAGRGAPHPDAPDVAAQIEDLELPFLTDQAVALAGEAVTVPLSYTDFRFPARARELLGRAGTSAGEWDWLGGWLGPVRPGQELAEGSETVFGRGGHLLGGLPYFAGDDPRTMPHYSSFTTLLLQIDSDVDAGLAWGDGGVCNFFIEPDRLAALDFSRVLYHWDCY
jgi:hypothetical protein